MPLQKITLKPGVNRENTRYTTEGGWYESDKIRFRQGTPEKIGGWLQTSANTFLGVCRSLWQWVTLDKIKYIGTGTNLKFYVARGGKYFDITPIRVTVTLGADPFATVNTSTIVTVTDVAHGAREGDFVTFSGATATGGIPAGDINKDQQITRIVDSDSYEIVVATTATSTATGGGAAVSAAYQINTGPEYQVPSTGWGAGPWGYGVWGTGAPSNAELRLWSQMNFGEDLVFAPRYGGLYYWKASTGVNVRGVNVTSLLGASDVPTIVQDILVSDVSRFVLAFGANPLGETFLDPMLIRWCNQEDIADWTPTATNQAGDLRLSHGSEISTAIQVRQEILVWTDQALYSLQYLGAPIVWGSTLMGDNISIVGPNSAVVASTTAYWMGVDKFYKYDGTVATLRCDLRQYVFSDINMGQRYQVTAGTNEGFNEVWWFYCSAASTVVDKYVIYNYVEDVWYYGTMGRTAWLDSGITEYPMAATYANNIVQHENGVDDGTYGVNALLPIEATITSAEFDIGDGHQFAFINRILPDVTFRGSTSENPAISMTLLPLNNSGSGYTNPASVGGTNTAPVVRSATVPVEQFTGQVFVRVRGRQMSIKVNSTALGVQWQLGSPRIDIRPDGRRG
jgi:hypothetical protein